MNDLIVFCAQYILIAVPIGWVVSWFLQSKHGRLQFVAATFIACVVAVVVSRIASKLYYDPRPFVAQHIKPLIPHAADNGFPSDHALFTMTLAAVTYFYQKRIAAVLFALAVLVGVSRVLAHVHSPIDIIGAWLIGCAAAIAGHYMANWVLKRYAMRTKKNAVSED